MGNAATWGCCCRHGTPSALRPRRATVAALVPIPRQCLCPRSGPRVQCSDDSLIPRPCPACRLLDPVHISSSMCHPPIRGAAATVTPKGPGVNASFMDRKTNHMAGGPSQPAPGLASKMPGQPLAGREGLFLRPTAMTPPILGFQATQAHPPGWGLTQIDDRLHSNCDGRVQRSNGKREVP